VHPAVGTGGGTARDRRHLRLPGSDDASFITAETILVDGGASMVDPCGASLSMSGASGWGADMRGETA